MPFPAKTYNNVGVPEARGRRRGRRGGGGSAETVPGPRVWNAAGVFKMAERRPSAGMSTASNIFWFSFDLEVYVLRFLHLFIGSTKS